MLTKKPESLAANFEQSHQSALRAAHRALPERSAFHEREDIAQETVLKLLMLKETVQNPKGLAATISQRTSASYIRKQQSFYRYKYRAPIPTVLDFNNDPTLEAAALEQRERLRAVLLSLESAEIIHLVAHSIAVPLKRLESVLNQLGNARTNASPNYGDRRSAIGHARERLAVN